MKSHILVRSFPSGEACNAAFIETLKTALTAPADRPQGIMISGGSSPLVAYRELTTNPVLAHDSVRLMFADDRHVSHESTDSNFHHVKPMADALGIADNHLFRVRDDLDLDAATEAYGQELDNFFHEDGVIPLGFLGMGTDGHTASLFSLEDADKLECTTLAVRDRGGFNRVSVSSAVLARVRRLIFLVTGPSKIEMMRNLLHNPSAIPAGRAVDGHPAVELWTEAPLEKLN
jgi:6-phosphogluconolactonase/glucosamine-6-phosphate isomerase/deaminase